MNYYVLVFFICISLLNANNLRNLEGVSASFGDKGDLTYEDGKIKFEITLNNDDNIEDGQNYTLAILIKLSITKLANCIYTKIVKKLACSLESTEPYYGSVIIVNSALARFNHVTIILGNNYAITLLNDISLKFKKAYDLYCESKNCTFK